MGTLSVRYIFFIALMTMQALFSTSYFTTQPHLSQCDPQSPLVFDTEKYAHVSLPRNYRSMHSTFVHPSQASRIGLEDIHASGSGQFSVEQLQAVMDHVRPYKILIIDLREEHHGFWDNEAISWYGLNKNQANKGIAWSIIINQEQRKLACLEKISPLIIHTVQKLDIHTKNRAFHGYSYSQQQGPIKTEADIAQEHACRYARIPVTDRGLPADLAIDIFIDIVSHKEPTEWTLIHCRAGKGRTTLFLLLYDMLLNAYRVSLKDIIERQYALGGVNIKSQEKLDLVKNFYDYAQARYTGYSGSWSRWKTEHPYHST